MPAKPKLGQNFLVNAEAIERTAASVGDPSVARWSRSPMASIGFQFLLR
jgi:hypothetical protein